MQSWKRNDIGILRFVNGNVNDNATNLSIVILWKVLDLVATKIPQPDNRGIIIKK